jgi:hypothetical protein
LGAQQLKSQYGSIRVRDRQNELVRIARDVTRIEAEIMAENFEPQTLLAMSQVDDLPSAADIQQQMMQLQQQVQQTVAQNPEAAQDPQMIEQAKGQLQQLQGTVTVEKVMELLRSQRIRPFVLEIETDSTIQPAEDAAKQRATEFVTAVGGFMAQAVPLAQTVPQAVPLTVEMLKFVAGQYRAGRELDSVLDKFAEDMKQVASQPPPPDPEMVKAEAEAKAADQQHQFKMQEMQTTATVNQQASRADMQMKAIDVVLKRLDLAIKKAAAKETGAEVADDAEIALPSFGAEPQQQDTAQTDALIAALDRFTAAASAPTEIVYNAEGRPAGARKVLN